MRKIYALRRRKMRTDLDFSQFRKVLEAQKTTIQQRLEQEIGSLRAYADSNLDLLDAATKLIAQGKKWAQSITCGDGKTKSKRPFRDSKTASLGFAPGVVKR
jgi:hypothetical protein